MAKGYLPILLVTPLKLQKILALVKERLTKTNPDYDILIKIAFVLWYEIGSFRHRQEKKFDYSISNVCPAIHTATINFISTRNSTSTSHR